MKPNGWRAFSVPIARSTSIGLPSAIAPLSIVDPGRRRQTSACSISIALLSAGRLGDGWRLMRARAELFTSARIEGVPCWSGEPLQGKCILVHSEQGLGGIIQFVRYLLGRSVSARRFQCLSADPAPVAQRPECQRAKSPVPDLGRLQFDYQAQLLDLPAMLATRRSPTSGASSLPVFESERPCLLARPAGGNRRPENRPGVVGQPKHKQDQHRSARLDDFAALAILPGVTWVLLPKGIRQTGGLGAA